MVNATYSARGPADIEKDTTAADTLCVENEIVGEALVALQHDDLKSMGIASVGHRLTILKSVYDVKKAQDVPIESDHYLPLCTLPPPPSRVD
jgi:hypothetical protein